MEKHDESPFQAVPPLVVLVAAVIFCIELVFQAAGMGLLGGADGVGWRLTALREYAVFDSVAEEMWVRGIFPPEHVMRVVTYPFIHGSFTHALFVCVFVLALGKMVAEAFSPLAFLALFIGASVFGALGFVAILDSSGPLVGGFPGAYGLIGGFTYILWVRASLRGDNRYRAFGLIAVLLVIQLGFGIVQGQYGNVVAEVSGFVAGFAMSFLVSPGGWRRLVASLRTR